MKFGVVGASLVQLVGVVGALPLQVPIEHVELARVYLEPKRA